MTTITTPSPSTADDATAFETVRQRCRQGHRGFYYACAFLPAPKRDAAFALRAFVELIEQAILTTSDPNADPVAPSPPATVGISCCSVGGLDQRLAMVRQRIDELYAGGALDLPLPEFRTPDQQVLLAAQHAIRHYEVPRMCWDHLIEGCDAEARTVRFATRASVQRFLRRRAGSVGRAMASVLGATHSDAAAQAEELAMGIRLAELLGQLSRDWQRGRLYLPLEDLARAGYSERDLGRGVVNDRFRQLIAGQIEQAREWFRAGAQMIPWLADDGSRLTAATLAVTAAGRLRLIEQARYAILDRAPELTWAFRARLLPSAWRLSRRRADEPLPAVF